MLNFRKAMQRSQNNKLPGVGMIALDVLPVAILIIALPLALAGRLS